jgi:hypothetical protein
MTSALMVKLKNQVISVRMVSQRAKECEKAGERQVLSQTKNREKNVRNTANGRRCGNMLELWWPVPWMWREEHFQEEFYMVPTGKREGGQEVRDRSAPTNVQASSRSVNKDVVNTNYDKEIVNKGENEISFCYFDRFKDCIFERKVGDNRFHVKVTLASMDFIAVLNSGSNVTILRRNTLKIIGKLDLEIEDVKLDIEVAYGRSHEAYGYVNAPFTFDDRTHIMPTLVVPSIGNGFLGEIWNCTKN